MVRTKSNARRSFSVEEIDPNSPIVSDEEFFWIVSRSGKCEMPCEFSLDHLFEIPVETSSSYDAAQSGGGLRIRIEIPVGKSTSFDDAFQPLSIEDEATVQRAFSSDAENILVEHIKSSIVITRNILSCFKPRHWVNDDVINLYSVLLKEREIRQPNKHLKCHFFSTFFFPKLFQSRPGYNYDSVKNWTTMKNLGYHIKDCEKIFVPIYTYLHWALVVINVKDQQFEYLDSYKGYDKDYTVYIDALARYYIDEVNHKNQAKIDVSQWRQVFVHDLPVQSNGFDCGIFVMKYMDFYSRGLDLCFSQKHIPYFRLRTAKEILQLRAD